MKSLITGIGGFAGRHLAALLLARGDEVHGTLHREANRPALRDLMARHRGLGERLYPLDVVDAAALAGVVAAVRPQALFHLAGMTFVPDATADPAAAIRVNVMGAVHVFAAVQRHAPSCRVVAVSSGDVYGAVTPDELPVRETCLLRPLTAYAASKAGLDLVAHQWARGARPPVLSVGDLDAVRDFTDVRDVAAAYVAAAERGERGEAYNVCSGIGRSVRSVLDALSAIVGVRVRTEVADQRLRPVSVPVIVGSADKLRAATGWLPRYDWHQTLADVVNDA